MLFRSVSQSRYTKISMSGCIDDIDFDKVASFGIGNGDGSEMVFVSLVSTETKANLIVVPGSEDYRKDVAKRNSCEE